MRQSDEGSIILVENPLCGNQSVGKALGLHDRAKVARWAVPGEARKRVGATKWKKAKKIVLVRDSVARFESAATYLLTHPDEFDEKTCEAAEAIRAEYSAPQARGGAVLKWLVNTPDEDRPVIFRQQVNWLRAKFDLVLATSDIASYFNHEGKVCCVRSPLVTGAVGAIQARMPIEGGRKLVDEAYADDIAFFERLLVWTPIPEEIRLVTGPCVACKKNDSRKSDGKKTASGGSSGKAWLDLTLTDEFEPKPTTKRTRTRRKKKEDVQ